MWGMVDTITITIETKEGGKDIERSTPNTTNTKYGGIIAYSARDIDCDVDVVLVVFFSSYGSNTVASSFDLDYHF